MRSNCLFFAVSMFIRNWHNGGHLIVRKSHFADFHNIKSKAHFLHYLPHFAFSRDEVAYEFVPTQEQLDIDKKDGVFLTVIKRLLTLWTFEGRIIKYPKGRIYE